MATSGFLAHMERGRGCHGISNAFFLYVRDPDGHRVELFTSDYLTVDPDLEPIRWSLRDPQRMGPPAPKSWFEEGSLFTGTSVREPALVRRSRLSHGRQIANRADDQRRRTSPLLLVAIRYSPFANCP